MTVAVFLVWVKGMLLYPCIYVIQVTRLAVLKITVSVYFGKLL